MIYDEEKGLWNKESVQRVGTHVLKAYVPFWMRGVSKIAEPTGGIIETAKTHPGKLLAPQVGIMPATKAYTQTDADALMDKYGSRFQFTRTPEEAEASGKKRDLYQLKKQGKTAKARELSQQGQKEGWLTDRKEQNIDKKVENAKAYRFKNLPNLGHAIKVYGEGTPEEKALYLPLLIDKIDNADRHNPEQYKKHEKEIKVLFQEYREAVKKKNEARKNPQNQLDNINKELERRGQWQ